MLVVHELEWSVEEIFNLKYCYLLYSFRDHESGHLSVTSQRLPTSLFGQTHHNECGCLMGLNLKTLTHTHCTHIHWSGGFPILMSNTNWGNYLPLPPNTWSSRLTRPQVRRPSLWQIQGRTTSTMAMTDPLATSRAFSLMPPISERACHVPLMDQWLWPGWDTPFSDDRPTSHCVPWRISHLGGHGTCCHLRNSPWAWSQPLTLCVSGSPHCPLSSITAILPSLVVPPWNADNMCLPLCPTKPSRDDCPPPTFEICTAMHGAVVDHWSDVYMPSPLFFSFLMTHSPSRKGFCCSTMPITLQTILFSWCHATVFDIPNFFFFLTTSHPLALLSFLCLSHSQLLVYFI